MKVIARNWGNGVGIRIPKEFLKYFNIENGTALNIERQDQTILLSSSKSVMNIDDLVEGMDPDDPNIVEMSGELGAEKVEGWSISPTSET